MYIIRPENDFRTFFENVNFKSFEQDQNPLGSLQIKT